MRTNVRIGNDIKLMWQILDGGVPVNLTNATDIKVSIAQGGIPSCNKIEITTFEVTDAVNGMVAVEVQKEVITELGYLWTVLEYTVPDSSMIDGNRKVTVDNVPVRIVAVTAEASQDSEFTVSSDIQAGFQGLSAYEVWLKDNPDKTKEEYYNWLQKPAIDIAETVGLQEQARVEAENARKNNEEQRVEAELLRQSSTQEAILNAENATENANTAAQNADNARLAIQDDLALKANHGYESNPKTLKEVEDDLVQLANNVSSNFEFINYMPGDLKIITPGVFLLDKNILLYNSKTGRRAYLYPQDTVFPKQITIPNLKIISLSTELLNQPGAPYLPEGSLVEHNYGSNLGDFIPIFGRSNNVYVGVFTKYLFGEKYASSETVSTLTNTVSTLNKNGKIYSVKEVSSSIPAMDIGEYYLNRTVNELYWKNTGGNVKKVETSIGDVVLVSGIRYVKIADGWEPERIGELLQHETTQGIYSYDNGEITRVNVAGWLCGKVDVKKGDIFSIRGLGGSASRLCILKDANGDDIYVSGPNLNRVSIPLSIICPSDGIMYFNYNASYAHEAYCTSSNIEDKEDPDSNTLLIKAIAYDTNGLDSYNFGDRYFSTKTGRLYENKNGSVDITDEVIEKDYDLFNEQDKTIYKILNGWIKPKGAISNVSFSPDYTMNDVSNDIVGFTFYGKTMEEVYAKYDALVSEYPDFVEKIDAAELVGIPYPRYANGILEGDAEYAETPAYKTYMYKFSNYSTEHGYDKNHQKFKIFIIAGVHGIERVGSITTYLFAKQLCDASSPNYFNLRSAFDVYIVPCLNGYGIYNSTRVNANGVDINRNYPTKRWRLTANDGITYSGPEKGSEFETQLVVALTDLIKPHVPMDWHNYGGLARQFYTTPLSEIGGKISYKALVDMSYAFIKNYPSYFGTKYQLFVETSTAIMPTHPVTPSGTSTDFWYHERNNHFGATYEVSNGINFLDGAYNPNQSDVNGADTLSIAEYIIRTVVMRIAEYVSQSDVNTVCNYIEEIIEL